MTYSSDLIPDIAAAANVDGDDTGDDFDDDSNPDADGDDDDDEAEDWNQVKKLLALKNY